MGGSKSTNRRTIARRSSNRSDFELAVNPLLSSLNCCRLGFDFRYANLDRAADLEPIFPNARLNPSECKINALVGHRSAHRSPQKLSHDTIRLAKLQQFISKQAPLSLQPYA